MLSMTHMIILFIVVLVVFGPHKLPELARGLGKLMAEFRKASTDFRSAFEQEMRDMERQQLQAERKRAAEATAAAAAANQPATLASPAGTPPASTNSDADTRATEALVVTPAPDSVARLESPEPSELSQDTVASLEAASPATPASTTSEPAPASHDQQQPA
jgi:sec-independent protein translocase protein TatB